MRPEVKVPSPLSTAVFFPITVTTPFWADLGSLHAGHRAVFSSSMTSRIQKKQVTIRSGNVCKSTRYAVRVSTGQR